MTIKELYEREKAKPTPAQAFIDDVCAVTKKDDISVRRWISGACAPDALTQDVLAKHFGIPAAKLFNIKKAKQ